jgi:sterol desaturase/sphingolipid hydroxylase (fatty acid hydroxylase superfamily)
LLEFSARSSGAASTILTIASIAVFLILFDVLLYWTHRAHHHVPFLWRFHAVHHSPRDLDALHNYVHPVEQLVRYFSVGLPLSFIVQIDEQQFYLVFTLLAVQNQLSHMNVPLNFGIFGNVLVDNRHHFIHHSSDPKHFNRNYAGIFSFTDRLFRTFEPAGVTLPTTGFSNNDIPRTLWEFILARKAAVASTRRRSRPLSQPVL